MATTGAGPRAVVIPFGVPPAGRGLGLGLAALVHGFAQFEGESVALAQLLSRPTDRTPSGRDGRFGSVESGGEGGEASSAATRGNRAAGRASDGDRSSAAPGPRADLKRDDSARQRDSVRPRHANDTSARSRRESELADGNDRDDDDHDHASGSRREADAAHGPGPVETFMPPHAWRDLAAQGDAPLGVRLVVTGAFDPPRDGPGMLELLAFDARDGMTRARVEAHLDGLHAGRAVLGALDELCRSVGGDVGTLRDLADLDWDALESVIRGERCLLHDPRRGGPHDRLAAMMHLGRAVEDAPSARFPAGRLAAIAIDTAVNAPDTRLAAAALRALERAAEDAPSQVDLREACAALHVRLGNSDAAEAGALTAIASDPTRARLYALLSEARRGRGDISGALAAVQRGLEMSASDPVLLTERGVILASDGDLTGARVAWEDAVKVEPLFAAAFTNLSTLVVRTADTEAAQALVDRALAARQPHPEVLRRAIHLALTAEAEGLPRAARISALARELLERTPNDTWAALMLARSLSQMGEKTAALAALAHIDQIAPNSAAATEAQRARFAIENPEVAVEFESVLRAALHGDVDDLGVIAARAQRLALDYPIWVPLYAFGVAERRRGACLTARRAFEEALVRAPGCSPALVELVGVCVSLEDHDAALAHAARAVLLEESPRTLAAQAAAFLAVKRFDEAARFAVRALALDPEDLQNRQLAARIGDNAAKPVAAPAEPHRGLFGWVASVLGKR